MASVPARVAEIARRHPGRTAIVGDDRRIDYAGFWRESLRFAHALRMRGLQPGERVAILLPNRIEAAVACYGTWLAGGIAAPLNAQARQRDFQAWLAHCDAHHVAFEIHHGDALAALDAIDATRTLPLERWAIDGEHPLLADDGIDATVIDSTDIDAGAIAGDDIPMQVTVSNPGTALVVNGTINGTLVANVSTVVSGTGSVSGAASVSGALNPGNSPGVLGFESDLTMAGSTATIMEINGAVRGTDYDGIDVGGTLTYDGTLTIDIGAIFAPGSYSWNLFDMTSETGTFSTVSVIGEYSGSLLDGDLDGVWDFSDPDNTWQFTESTGTLSLVTVVPEPGAALLGGLGLLALLRRRR